MLTLRTLLNMISTNQWLGCGGSISWSARTPNRTLFEANNFSLWKTLKNILYQEAPSAPGNMRYQIVAICATVSRGIKSIRTSAIQLHRCSKWTWLRESIYNVGINISPVFNIKRPHTTGHWNCLNARY